VRTDLLGLILTNPWFWVSLSATGWFLWLLVVGSSTFGSRTWFGVAASTLAVVPRVLLPLPFVEQPRFADPHRVLVLIGLLLFCGTAVFATPVLRIQFLTRPSAEEPLQTSGLYALVRHPVMFFEAFWPLGWSLSFGSVLGIALTPLWLLLSWLLTVLEEERLLEAYGDRYQRYREQVPRRLVPFLPRGPHPAERPADADSDSCGRSPTHAQPTSPAIRAPGRTWK
jgi:protein-S-isoprenylcysteine O-methyltransferase Ste14